MKKSWKISLLISLIVLLGSLVTGVITYSAYSKILKDSTRNVAELSTMNVYSKIDNELTKPIYVSLTMAHDSFLIEWLSRESVANQNEVISYLDGVQEKYGYNSVFLVSSSTDIYYYYEGINKVVSRDDDHDVWYYSFIDSSDSYNLDVDVDEVTGVLTIFINVKIFDDDENLLAVVGVGVEMDYVLSIIQEFEENYYLTVYLIDDTGLIQSSTDVNLIESKNILEDIDSSMKNTIIEDKEALLTQSISRESKYIISRYINDLDWYIVVEKDTNVFARFFLDYFWLSLVMIGVILIAVSNIIIYTVNVYQKRISILARTDYLTNLLNRRGFSEAIEELDSKDKTALVFMTDVDGFKQVNDRFGHSIGDEVLKYIGTLLNDFISPYGKLARWGGDEFTGFMFGDVDQMKDVLSKVTAMVKDDVYLKDKKISLSIGYALTDFSIELDEVLYKVDKALYEAKASGGDKIVYKE